MFRKPPLWRFANAIPPQSPHATDLKCSITEQLERASRSNSVQKEHFSSDLIGILRALEKGTLNPALDNNTVSEKSCGQFVSFLTHDVRTSLSAILGFVERLYDSKQSTQERFQCLGRIRSTIGDMSQMLEDLQHLSSLEQGELSMRSTRFPLESELKESLIFLKSLARKLDLRFEVRSKGPVPDAILSDPLRVRELLVNLVGVMMQKTDRGVIRVTLELTQNPTRLEFLIDSSGPNLPKELLWEGRSGVSPYHLVEVHGRAAIGLSLGRSLAEVLGGGLTFENSKIGKGIAIRAKIDPGPIEAIHLKDSLEVDDNEGPLGHAKTFSLPNLEGKRFLVIEDDPDISALLASFLRKTRAEVDVAQDGVVGRDRARAERYNLIFMDLQIPKINGLEVTSQLRREGIKTPIVAITAHSSVVAKTKSLEAGCNLFLTKPLSMEALFKMISHVSL